MLIYSKYSPLSFSIHSTVSQTDPSYRSEPDCAMPHTSNGGPPRGTTSDASLAYMWLLPAPTSKHSSVKKQGKEANQQNETKKWLSRNNMSKIHASSSALYMQVLQTSKAIRELPPTAKSNEHIMERARVWRQSQLSRYLFSPYVTMKNRPPQIKADSCQRPKRTPALKISW